LVVGLLGFGGTAIVALWSWHRRRAARTPPAAPDPDESHRRDRAAQSSTAIAGLLILGLGLLTALVPMGSGAALLVLGLGATIGTAGFALGSPRTGRDGFIAEKR
jgi:peptidoglycan/LPS O-acetylase OafA/YrhL